MKTVSILALVLFLSAPVAAQDDWSWSNPTPQGNTLHDVSLTDDGLGWAVGDYGTILVTSDGGLTWSHQSSGTTEHLHSVQTFTVATAFAMGEAGTVFKTFDGGDSWAATPMARGGTINAAYWLDEMRAWAVGNDGMIRMTIDGAVNWVDQTSGTAEHLNDVMFADGVLGIAVGNNETILSTDDGGATWLLDDVEDVDAPGRSVPDPEDIYSVDIVVARGETVAAAAGARTSLRVRKLGGNRLWRRTRLGFNNRFNKAKIKRLVSAPPPQIEVAVTGAACQGTATINYDTGKASITWQPAPADKIWQGLAIVDLPLMAGGTSTGGATPTRMIRVGEDGATAVSDDDGETWQSISQGLTTPLHAIHASQDGVWAAGQRGVILFSADGDPPWQEQPLGGVSHTMNAIHFVDGMNGWAAGTNGRIYHTSNGGASWQLQTSGTTETLYSIRFVDGSTGWATGRVGTVLSTTDGGATWTPRPSGANGNLLSVAFGDSQTGWITSDGGLILASTDGGLTWTPQPSGTTNTLRSVSAIDASTAVAVGIGGTILKTTDGGMTWMPQNSGTGAYLRSVHFHDAASAWAAGFEGTVVRTTDGGDTWSVLVTPTDRHLQAVAFSSPTDGFVAGEGGTILSTSTGGGTISVEGPQHARPAALTLLQLYPNPAPMVAHVAFELHVAGHVSVRVFDVLGRPVATVAEGDLPAGRHEYAWDTTRVASGMYVWRLSSGSDAVAVRTVVAR